MKISFAAVAAFSLGVALIAGACSDTLVEGSRPHTAELTADRTTAAVGDSIEFFLQGSGELLAGIAIEYGDGTADTVPAEGAVTATMRRKHAYGEAGSYEAIGTVVDGTAIGLVELSDTVQVTITGGGS